MLGDLLKMLRTDSPVQWDLAVQLAQTLAAGDDKSVSNVDPAERIRFEELFRIAELYVADITGMASPSGSLRVVPAGRVEWASRSLAEWRPFLETLAASLRPPGPVLPDEADEVLGDGDAAGGISKLIEQFTTVMAPAMLAMQVGSIVGHLARHSFGQYELPLPRPENGEQLVIPDNVITFAEDWSLPPDDVRMWVCLSAAVNQLVLSHPHVPARLEMLLLEHARGFTLDPTALEQRLSGTDPTDFASLSRLLGEPSALGHAVETPELRRVRSNLSALTAMIAGYAEHVTSTAAARLIGSHTAVREALRRRRVERSEGERGAEMLFGLSFDQELVDRGVHFVGGVLDRGGEAELAKLWVVEANLPTPAEVDAPGLWIERVNLPPDDEPSRPPDDATSRPPALDDDPLPEIP